MVKNPDPYESYNYNPDDEEVGTIRIGYNNTIWIIEKNKEFKKYWKLFGKNFSVGSKFITKLDKKDNRLSNLTSDEYKNLFKLINLKKELLKYGVNLLIYILTDWKITDDKIGSNYIRDQNDWYKSEGWEKIPDNKFDKPFILYSLRLDTIQQKFIIFDDIIQLEYNFNEDEKIKENVLKILRKNFIIEYSGNDLDLITIKLNNNNCVII